MADDNKTVLDVMKKAGKPLKNAEIVELSGLSKAVVTQSIKELKESGDIHSPKRCFYAPK